MIKVYGFRRSKSSLAERSWKLSRKERTKCVLCSTMTESSKWKTDMVGDSFTNNFGIEKMDSKIQISPILSQKFIWKKLKESVVKWYFEIQIILRILLLTLLMTIILFSGTPKRRTNPPRQRNRGRNRQPRPSSRYCGLWQTLNQIQRTHSQDSALRCVLTFS